jgi:hypothetical protein
MAWELREPGEPVELNVLLGIIAAATIGTRHVKRSQLLQRAPQPSPKPETATTSRRTA